MEEQNKHPQRAVAATAEEQTSVSTGSLCCRSHDRLRSLHAAACSHPAWLPMTSSGGQAPDGLLQAAGRSSGICKRFLVWLWL